MNRLSAYRRWVFSECVYWAIFPIATPSMAAVVRLSICLFYLSILSVRSADIFLFSSVSFDRFFLCPYAFNFRSFISRSYLSRRNTKSALVAIGFCAIVVDSPIVRFFCFLFFFSFSFFPFYFLDFVSLNKSKIFVRVLDHFSNWTFYFGILVLWNFQAFWHVRKEQRKLKNSKRNSTLFWGKVKRKKTRRESEQLERSLIGTFCCSVVTQCTYDRSNVRSAIETCNFSTKWQSHWALIARTNDWTKCSFRLCLSAISNLCH